MKEPGRYHLREFRVDVLCTVALVAILSALLWLCAVTGAVKPEIAYVMMLGGTMTVLIAMRARTNYREHRKRLRQTRGGSAASPYKRWKALHDSEWSYFRDERARALHKQADVERLRQQTIKQAKAAETAIKLEGHRRAIRRRWRR